jgi:hypothetical protein
MAMERVRSAVISPPPASGEVVLMSRVEGQSPERSDAPVPPFAMARIPLRVNTPVVVMGPPLNVNPVVPPEASTDVTEPDPPVTFFWVMSMTPAETFWSGRIGICYSYVCIADETGGREAETTTPSRGEMMQGTYDSRPVPPPRTIAVIRVRQHGTERGRNFERFCPVVREYPPDE